MQSINFDKLEKLDFQSNEAYNTLRTNILFCGKDNKAICFTSCSPNEGKSVVSFRLACSLAESGKKVLFIDADLRKSVLVGRLKVDRAVFGLTHYLSGMKELEEVLYSTNVENLDIILAGPVPPNPSELLGSATCEELVRQQREIYDYVFIDTPPLGVVIDSANVAKFCDGTILVIESGNISYKYAQSVIKQLEKGNCKVLGAVLNKVETRHRKYAGKYYGGYYGIPS
jgi:capsular exopolysaccharide synthesis family protein